MGADMGSSFSTLRKFVSPEIIFGGGARKLAGQYVANFGASKTLVVSDKGVKEAGWLEEILQSLEQEKIACAVFTDVSPNPRETQVMAAAQMYLEEGCDTIVAVGGGSAMDLAKAAAIVVTNGGHILDYEGVDKIRQAVPPLVLIPTTAGSSADVSQFTIITNQSERVKIAIISKTIVPDVALIDPETTLSMSPKLTAETGIDALVHAIEAFVSTAHSPLTDIHAIEAIKLINAHLPAAVQNPSDYLIRENIMRASMEAGLAFSNAILGAVHAMAHSLGGYMDLPHGECNAILLENVIDFNFDRAADRYTIIAEAMKIPVKGLTSSEIKKAMVAHIIELKKMVGISHKLESVGVNKSDIPALAGKAKKDACLLTNPRKAEQRDIEVLYEEAL